CRALHDAGHRLPLALPASAHRPRPAEAVAAYRRVDDVWPTRLHLVVADTEAFGRPRREVLDDDVGTLYEFPEEVEPLLLTNVEQHRALTAIEVAADAAVGFVDLGYLSAGLAEESPARRSGESDAEIEHAQAIEGRCAIG